MKDDVTGSSALPASPESAKTGVRAKRSGAGGLGRRLALAWVAPVIVLGLAELALRLVGFGTPTGYFVPGPAPGTWVENPAFGRRFFPSGLLRVPPPTRVTIAKTPGTIRVVVFGESAAMGDPKPGFGLARYLEVLLRERYPKASFEVIPAAMTAINSHALLPMARQCTELNADYWVVFAGNNETLGPFGAGSALGGRSLGPSWVRWVLAAKATRLGQAVESLSERLRDRPIGSSRWAGLKLLAEENIPWNTPRREAVYAAFERNLGDLVRVGKNAGARVLLGTVAVNLADCGPFGSELPANLAPDERARWSAVLDAASRSLTNLVPELDATSIHGVASNAPGHAGIQYLHARVLQNETNGAVVRDTFARARDLDTVPLRTDSRQNDIVRRLARQYAVPLVDTEAALIAASERGVPGREFFYEHVHLTPEGNHALARAFAERLAELLPESAKAGAEGDWASPESCATRLALTPWGRAAAAELMLKRILDAPFTNRVDQEFQVMALAEEVSRQRRAQTPQAARFVVGIYTNAIAAAPDDPHLRRAYAEFLEATGNLKEAAAQWRRVLEWLPHHPVAYMQTGSLLRRLGNLDEAEPLLSKAVALQPDWVEARLEQADLLLARGRPTEAVAACEAALKIQPDHARAYLRLADAFAANKQGAPAVASLQEAIRWDPRLYEARYLLGVEYALAGNVESAREQFEAVIRIRPDHARARFNLGIALARQGRWDAAAVHLAEAVRLDPRHEPSKQALAQVEGIRKQPTPTSTNAPANNPPAPPER